jgi:hypothetical protein
MRIRAELWPAIVAAPIAIALLVYSQTMSFAWDEGFHVLAAQLIAVGKRPYADFVFPQTPLNAWITALAMLLFGQSWRVAHAVQALATSGAVFLATDYVYRRLPDPRWKLPAAAATALLTGLNVVVFEYGTVGQSYGMCLLLTMVAFRLAVAEAPAVLTGLGAGAAAASSLLTAPVVLVLAGWFGLHRRARSLAAFVGGAVIPFLPIAWLFTQSPGRAWFNVVGFQVLYRRVQWSDWFTHDVDVDTAWSNSTQALLLIRLAGAGMVLVRKSGWNEQLRREMYLCAAIAGAQTLYLLNIHPGFARYYLLAVPFAGILSGVGLALVGASAGQFRWWPVAAIAVVMGIGVTRYAIEDRDDFSWPDFEKIGQRINQVTAPGAPLYADEHAYFEARRIPPVGMSFNYSHKVELPPAEAAALGIVSRSQLEKQISAHAFATYETCESEEEIGRLGLPKIYSHRADIGNCAVFW